MFKRFKPQPSSVLGVDISVSSVKIVEMSRLEEGFRIERYGCQPIPASALDGYLIKNVDVVSACIQNLLTQEQLISKKVVLAVPDSAVISRILYLKQVLNEAEIEALVITEATHLISYPIDEMYLDFEVLGASLIHPGMIDVLMVASHSEQVNSRVEAVVKAGLEPRIVDVESYALERVLQQISHEALVNFDFMHGEGLSFLIACGLALRHIE